jgi:hypothetical protein
VESKQQAKEIVIAIPKVGFIIEKEEGIKRYLA